MSDRKYRQHGYQDRGDERNHNGGGAPRPKPAETFGPRQVNMAPTRSVSRCAQCGAVLAAGDTVRCAKCGFELHSCKQCSHFDPASRFECRQPIKERVARKDEANLCGFYSIAIRVERETSSSPATSSSSAGSFGRSNRVEDAKRAFDALFKK